MNKYGHKYGYHTPHKTEVFFEKIEKETGLTLTDSSWHNDLCDSMLFEEYFNDETGEGLHLFLPNSDEMNVDKEKYNTFALITDGEFDPLIVTESVDEVIEYLKEHFPSDDIGETCRNGKPWKDCDCC